MGTDWFVCLLNFAAQPKSTVAAEIVLHQRRLL